jgi:hypothetical protein
MRVEIREPLDLETILGLLAAGGFGAFLASLMTPIVSSYFEREKIKRDRRISDLKENIAKLWRLVFYFGNMRSWGVFVGAPYAFATEVLGRYLDEMAQMVKLEMGFVEPRIQKLWFDWQPYAVAAVERRRRKRSRIYPKFTKEEFYIRSERLHEAVEAEWKKALKQYNKELGTRKLLDVILGSTTPNGS